MMDEPYQPVYFIGISLPADLNRQISQLQWRLRELDRAMLRPVLPHVTLLHPPSLQGVMPSELLPRVREIAERYLPLTIALQTIDFFGATVCFISAQSHQLDSLQAQLVKILPPAVRESHYKRPYKPHITVAQIYEPKSLDKPMLHQIIAHEISLPQQFTVESVSYFKRILPREYRAETL